MKIVFTGGSGRFGKIFKSKIKLKNIFYPNKKELNILNISSIKKYLSKKNQKLLFTLQAYQDQWICMKKILIKV